MKLSFILCLFLVIFSCKNEETEDFVSFNPSELSVLSSQASNYKFTVTANQDWKVTSSQSWCKVSPESGVKGTTEITVTVDENKTNLTRSAVLTFKAGTSKKGFNISQKYFVPQVLFADDAFKNYCITNFDTDKDGSLSVSEAAAVNTLNISNLNISSLDGIENFVNLKTLDVSNNKLTTISVAALKSLTSLNCANNQLIALDIQSNVNLKSLDCTGNVSLTTIHVWTGFNPGTSFLKPANATYVQPTIPTPPGYTLVWQDEFNDSRDASGKAALPNTSKWWYETGGGGWGNNELETYIAATSGTDTCAAVSNGTLKIIAKKVSGQVLSIRMNTIASWTYGYFEARLKLPSGKGTWPAFWMMPKNFTAWPDDGEVDIMEHVGYRPNYVSSSIHCKAYNHAIGTQKTAEKYVATALTDFHVYAVEWTPDFIKGYIDGEVYFEFDNDHTSNYATWPFFKPFYLKLNLAWGGNWGGAQGVDESVLPATYEVDYVRVFQK